MPFAVSTASAADLPAACALLFPHAGPDALAAAGVDPAGVLAATDRRGAVCGAVLALPLPGALGLVWPPRGDPAAADALAAAAAAHLRAARVKVGQAFVSPADRPAAAPLERHGFAPVTQLLSFRLPLPAGAAAGPTPLTLTPATADPPAFRRTLLATHADSLDCPEMNAGRTPDELAAGFAPPAGGPGGFWFLAEARGTPVGVLMLDRGSEPRVTDLLYLGVVPAARGQGYGAALVRAAIREAAGGGRELALAVDARNGPAVRVYRGFGFRLHDTREVFLARWG